MSEALHSENVFVLHPYTEEQALDDLRALGRTRLRICDLARRWQWPQKRTGRALERWIRDRLIFRRQGVISTLGELPGAPLRQAANDDLATPSVPRPRTVPDTPVAPSQDVSHAVSQIASKDTVPNSHKWLGALAILLGSGLSLIGLGWSIMSLTGGRSGAAGWLMAAVCVGIELVAVLSPSIGTGLWTLRCRAFAVAIWTGYAAALGFVIFQGIGFVGMQIGDTVAGRGHIIGASTDWRGELAARLQERGTLKFAPADPSQIETAEDERDRACDNGKKTCADLGAKVTALGKQRAVNERLVVLDGEIKDIRGKLAIAPALSTADPQIESAMKVLALASLTPAREAIETGRLLGLVLIPCVMGGLLLPAGMLLWQGRRA